MNTRIRYAAYSLVGISIVLTLLLGYPEVNRSGAKGHAVMPTAGLGAGTIDTVPGTVTLSAASVKTSDRYFQWAEKHWYCSAPSHAFEVRPSEENIPGTIVAGFWHRYDSGALVAGRPDGDSEAYRGFVWFDLSDLMSKAAPLHLSVQSATLHFGSSRACPGELLVATADWLKGYPDNTLVPGDPNAVAEFTAWPSEGANVNVQIEVSNWLRGEANGGYANYGFVFRGLREGDVAWKDADACVSRLRDFTLTVNYTYDKEAKVATYPLECRGTKTFNLLDLDGPPGSKWVGFNFIPGTKPAREGLLPGQCSWLDRGMRSGEPDKLAQAIGGAGDWSKELSSSDSYWTFDVYNAGAQLQATGAERSKKFFVPLLRTNFALASNGATAKPSSTLSIDYDASGAINGDRAGINWEKGGGWADATLGIFPDLFEVVLKGSHTIDRINVYTLQDNYKSPTDPGEPSNMVPFTTAGFGLTAFEVQVLDGSTWVTVGSVKESDPWYVGRQFNFKAVTTDRIRVLTLAAVDKGYSRITEVEAWGFK